jgi:hypothetical protein
LPVLTFNRVRVVACLTYFETRLLSQARQATPSGQRIDSRKSLQASGVAKVFETSIKFIQATNSLSANCCQVDNHAAMVARIALLSSRAAAVASSYYRYGLL